MVSVDDVNGRNIISIDVPHGELDSDESTVYMTPLTCTNLV